MLVEGLGVEGDAHNGVTVQHLWDIQRDPTKPNLRQVRPRGLRNIPELM